MIQFNYISNNDCLQDKCGLDKCYCEICALADSIINLPFKFLKLQMYRTSGGNANIPGVYKYYVMEENLAYRGGKGSLKRRKSEQTKTPLCCLLAYGK